MLSVQKEMKLVFVSHHNYSYKFSGFIYEHLETCA